MTSTNLDVDRTNPSIQNLSVKITIDERRVGLIHSKDIVECYFIEDIFSFNMYGKLVFYDKYGLIERGPLTGTEIITLVYGVEQVREVAFHIWKLNNIVQVADTNPTDISLIEIYFVDTSHYMMTIPKYSRSFTAGQKHTDVVKHFLKFMVGWADNEILMEPSSNSLTDNWSCPYWNVSDSIKWLLKRAIGSNTGKSGYLCYNNTYESIKVNLYTLNWLFSGNNFVDDTDYLFESQEDSVQNKIFEWWIKGVDHSTIGVMRGGKFRGFDPAQKKLLYHEYKYTDGVRDTILNGKKSLFTDLSDLTSSQITYGEQTLQDLMNVAYADWVKQYSLQNILTIILQGNEKRYAGHQIQIKWSSIDKVEQIWQKQLEGKYLVKSITHNFVGMGTSSINYMQRMSLIKNAYSDSDSQSLVKATQANLSLGKKQRIILPI